MFRIARRKHLDISRFARDILERRSAPAAKALGVVLPTNELVGEELKAAIRDWGLTLGQPYTPFIKQKRYFPMLEANEGPPRTMFRGSVRGVEWWREGTGVERTSPVPPSRHGSPIMDPSDLGLLPGLRRSEKGIVYSPSMEASDRMHMQSDGTYAIIDDDDGGDDARNISDVYYTDMLDTLTVCDPALVVAVSTAEDPKALLALIDVFRDAIQFPLRTPPTMHHTSPSIAYVRSVWASFYTSDPYVRREDYFALYKTVERYEIPQPLLIRIPDTIYRMARTALQPATVQHMLADADGTWVALLQVISACVLGFPARPPRTDPPVIGSVSTQSLAAVRTRPAAQDPAVAFAAVAVPPTSAVDTQLGGDGVGGTLRDSGAGPCSDGAATVSAGAAGFGHGTAVWDPKTGDITVGIPPSVSGGAAGRGGPSAGDASAAMAAALDTRRRARADAAPPVAAAGTTGSAGAPADPAAAHVAAAPLSSPHHDPSSTHVVDDGTWPQYPLPSKESGAAVSLNARHAAAAAAAAGAARGSRVGGSVHTPTRATDAEIAVATRNAARDAALAFGSAAAAVQPAAGAGTGPGAVPGGASAAGGAAPLGGASAGDATTACGTAASAGGAEDADLGPAAPHAAPLTAVFGSDTATKAYGRYLYHLGRALHVLSQLRLQVRIMRYEAVAHHITARVNFLRERRGALPLCTDEQLSEQRVENLKSFVVLPADVVDASEVDFNSMTSAGVASEVPPALIEVFSLLVREAQANLDKGRSVLEEARFVFPPELKFIVALHDYAAADVKAFKLRKCNPWDLRLVLRDDQAMFAAWSFFKRRTFKGWSKL